MGITFFWDNEEHNRICYHYEGIWNWQDLYNVLQASQELWDSVDHVVDIIVDMNQSRLPLGNPGPHFRYIAEMYRSPKVGNTAVITTDNFLRFFGNTFSKIYNVTSPSQKTFFTADLEEGRALLNAQRTAGIS